MHNTMLELFAASAPSAESPTPDYSIKKSKELLTNLKANNIVDELNACPIHAAEFIQVQSETFI